MKSRATLVRLAYKNAALRPQILAKLKESSATSKAYLVLDEVYSALEKLDVRLKEELSKSPFSDDLHTSEYDMLKKTRDILAEAADTYYKLYASIDKATEKAYVKTASLEAQLHKLQMSRG
jgi:hypothetical protein